MSVIIYGDSNPHPSGGTCILVTRSVDGESRQRYFALTSRNIQQAHELDALWQAEQKAAALERKQRAAPTSRASNHTTVRGIRFTVRTERKTNQNGVDRIYHMPMFEVSAREDMKRGAPKRFRIAQSGYEGAWQAAVQWLAQVKGIEDYSGLVTRIPPRSKTLGAWQGCVPEATTLCPIST